MIHASMKFTLPLQVKRHVEAAEGWLGLGDWREAQKELDAIDPTMQGRPKVLLIRFEVYAAAGNWEPALEVANLLSGILPDEAFGLIYKAHALHKMKRTREAFELLSPAAKQFPKERLVFYNLAGDACQLGDLKAARALLKKAFAIRPRDKAIKQAAVDNPDLGPLWKSMGGG